MRLDPTQWLVEMGSSIIVDFSSGLPISNIHQRKNTLKNIVHLIQNNATNDRKFSTNGECVGGPTVVPTRNAPRERRGQRWYQHVTQKVRRTKDGIPNNIINRSS